MTRMNCLRGYNAAAVAGPSINHPIVCLLYNLAGARRGGADSLENGAMGSAIVSEVGPPPEAERQQQMIVDAVYMRVFTLLLTVTVSDYNVTDSDARWIIMQ